MDPSVVQTELDAFMPGWKIIPATECEMLAAARQKIGPVSTTDLQVNALLSIWDRVQDSPGQANYSLPTVTVNCDTALEIIRSIESIIIDGHFPSVLVYWSRQNVTSIFPDGKRFINLHRYAYAISAFSARESAPPFSSGLWLESSDLCVSIKIHSEQ